ncbi:MAG TPA: four helix bundle protein [Candidatus Methylomirabilis sp.]|nr:four helix bundle protein [Candidatus Methylomirabilis sp.]
MVDRFEDLNAWKTVRELTRLIFELTEKPEFSRDYSLKDQIRRASVSAMSDIAEGFESRTQGLFVDLLGRAKGSAAEVRSDLYVALDRQYISNEEFGAAYDLADKAARQIANLMAYLESTPRPRRTRKLCGTRATRNAERSTVE